MDNFNVIIAGVGGQGIITLLSILNEACVAQGYDVKSSELHGLSQRGGSVITHVKFGNKVNSPLVSLGEADLVIGLEISEALREMIFSGPKTIFLVNNFYMPFLGNLTKEEILSSLHKNIGKRLHIVEASEKCQQALQKEVVSTTYLLGYAVRNNLIPLKKESIITAIKKVVPEKHLELNIKAFNLAYGN